MRAEVVREGFSVDANTGARSRSLGGISEPRSDVIQVIPAHGVEGNIWSFSETLSNTGEGLMSVHNRLTVSASDLLPATASSCESYEYPQRGGESAGRSAESVGDRVNSFLVSGLQPGVLEPAWMG